jgi:hypothetical protein
VDSVNASIFGPFVLDQDDPLTCHVGNGFSRIVWVQTVERFWTALDFGLKRICLRRNGLGLPTLQCLFVGKRVVGHGLDCSIRRSGR